MRASILRFVRNETLSACDLTPNGAAGLLAAVLAIAGCSGKDAPMYPDPNSYCGGRAQAECSKDVIQACGIPNATTCTTKRQTACVATTPAGTYSPSGAEACIKVVSTGFADARLSADENRNIVDACVTVFEGTGLANAACKLDSECKMTGGLRCVLRGGSDTGTCQIPQRVQGGGVCSGLNQTCVTGFHCGPTEHCDINGQVGEPCNAALPCVPSARCTLSERCEKKLDDGSICTSDQECLNSICARGTSSPEGRCVAVMTLAPNEPFCVDAR
jgi:hypothetical protein